MPQKQLQFYFYGKILYKVSKNDSVYRNVLNLAAIWSLWENIFLEKYRELDWKCIYESEVSAISFLISCCCAALWERSQVPTKCSSKSSNTISYNDSSISSVRNYQDFFRRTIRAMSYLWTQKLFSVLQRIFYRIFIFMLFS